MIKDAIVFIIGLVIMVNVMFGSLYFWMKVM